MYSTNIKYKQKNIIYIIGATTNVINDCQKPIGFNQKTSLYVGIKGIINNDINNNVSIFDFIKMSR